MGRKKISPATAKVPSQPRKLSQQKRNDLNNLTDYLLKLGFDSTTTINDMWTQYIEIQSLLERIHAIESELKIKSNAAGNRSAAVQKFYDWARDNGAQFDGVEIQQIPRFEFGLVAAKDFRCGEQFVSIPQRMILSIENAGQAVLDVLAQLPVLDAMPNVRLAFALVIERLNGNDSFWKPYIDLLPSRYSTVMYFTSHEMNELKGSSAFVMALNQCKHVARQYAFIRKAIQNIADNHSNAMLHVLKERFTYDLYCWAVSTVMTRQNAIPLSNSNDNNNDANKSTIENENKPEKSSPADDSSTPALIPLWDMANHLDGSVTTNYNMSNAQVEGATLNDIKKGEQIFIHYGNRNNANLLVHNGFVMEQNQSDSVVIHLGLSQSDVLVKQRTQLLENIGITKTTEITALPMPKYISPELLAFVRVFNMNEEQLNHWLAPNKQATDLLHLDCALDTSLELKTWNFLKMRLMLLLKAFPTSQTDDVALLEQHQRKGQQKLDHIKTMSVQYRISEKRILTDALSYIEERTTCT